MPLTLSDVCERYGVNAATVLGWIRRGELKAFNVGRAPGKKKARYRISETALQEFEAGRQIAVVQPVRRKRNAKADFIDFYK